MRYRLLASYQGAPYEAGIGPSGADLVLFAACPPPEDLGFEPATGHWRKQVERHEVEALWESRPIGQFGGEPCIVLDDLGDRLHIVFVGHDSIRAAQLGYWEVDRGVFELVTPRQNVADIVEERRPLPPMSAVQERAALPPPPAAARGPSRGTGPRAGRSSAGAAAAAAAMLAPAPLPPGPPAGPLMPPGPGPDGNAPPARQGRGKQQPPRQPAAARQSARARQQADPVTGPITAAQAVALPLLDEPPLPLEAQALLAATAARSEPASRPDHTYPGAPPGYAAEPRARTSTGSHQVIRPMHDSQLRAMPSDEAGPAANGQAGPRRRRAKRRLPTQRIFSDLATLAAIPATAYAVDEEVDGAMCLIRTAEGFEVFNAADGAKLEARVFNDEESAYFYLFGVLAAEAVRTGVLAPRD